MKLAFFLEVPGFQEFLRALIVTHSKLVIFFIMSKTKIIKRAQSLPNLQSCPIMTFIDISKSDELEIQIF